MRSLIITVVLFLIGVFAVLGPSAHPLNTIPPATADSGGGGD